MKDGILVLNKPRNWTSHDCVAVCRRVLGVKKIGHGGTLDPMATGLLPVFIGKATRIMEYLDADYKTYRCTARLGIVTDTQDIWGKVLMQKGPGPSDGASDGISEAVCEGISEAVCKEPSEAASDGLSEAVCDGLSEAGIRQALESFRGRIQQIPPKYSALKVNGKKLYQYAREGREVEIKPREVEIRGLDILKIDLEAMEVSFQITCSKGTYIRAICHDLGEKLGCGAAMAALERTASGVFDLTGAVSSEALKTMEPDRIWPLVLPVDYPLIHFGKAELATDRAVYFRRGNAIRWSQVSRRREPDAGFRLYKVYETGTELFIGTGYYDEAGDALKADKIFV